MTFYRSWLMKSALIAVSAVLLSGVLFLGRPRPAAPVALLDSDPSGCTTAVISGRATANGRPMIWKNRDVSQPHQEIVYFADGVYPYVTIANAGDNTQAWGGVNSVGFAIEDANNWNTPDTVSGPDDDGLLIKRALRTCQTVADFQQILDSTRVRGYAQPAIFGVIDAHGGAAMFETFSHTYLRYDANDSAAAPRGILVRSNYSYAGSQSGRIGVVRHNRAKSLIEAAEAGDSLTPFFICRTVARDLYAETLLNPYPLPYEGRQGGLPTGWISTYGAICRRLTVSACVIEGVLPTENPLLATLYAFPMAVQYGVALPFWVASATTPAEVNSDTTGPLCDVGLRIKTLAQHVAGFHDTLDTYILADGHGGGVHATTLPLEDQIFARTDSALAVWRQAGAPNPAGMSALSAELAALAYDSLAHWPGPGDLWVPPRRVHDLTLAHVPGQGLQLRWSAVTEDTLGLPISPAGYSIWRRSAAMTAADSVGTTTQTTYWVSEPADSSYGVFEVRAIR
jgi:hypothetical protein